MPDRAGAPPALAASETYRWLRRSVAIAVPILAVNTVVTAFADSMPAVHHVAVLPAVAVMVAARAIELAGARWPRLALIAGVVLPNGWLTLIGHDQANYLFLSLLQEHGLAAALRARLEVADDRVGFELSLQGADGFGLHGMRERVERLAGMLRIDSAPGQGTRVHVELPR